MAGHKGIWSLAILAGGVLPLAAMAQQQRGMETKPRPAIRDWQLKRSGRYLVPVRVAGAIMIDGHIQLTTGWMRAGNGAADTDTTPYFDCAELDITGAQPNPIGFCDGGCANNCVANPGAGPDSRWWSGPTYLGPQVVNDFTVGAAFNNAHATRAIVGANWGETTPTDLQLFVGTAETFNASGTPPPESGDYQGVIADFGPQAGGPTAGYFVLDADVSATALFFQMPSDGSGAIVMQLLNSATTLDGAVSTQFMYWGTGDAENPNDGRVGTQGPFEYDDDNPADGQFTAAEFYNEGGLGICPDPVGPMITFYGPPASTPSCYANCDHSTGTPFLNVADFTCFLQKFSTGNAYANCDNSTSPPTLNVADFTCFLQKFSIGCSAP